MEAKNVIQRAELVYDSMLLDGSMPGACRWLAGGSILVSSNKAFLQPGASEESVTNTSIRHSS